MRSTRPWRPGSRTRRCDRGGRRRTGTPGALAAARGQAEWWAAQATGAGPLHKYDVTVPVAGLDATLSVLAGILRPVVRRWGVFGHVYEGSLHVPGGGWDRVDVDRAVLTAIRKRVGRCPPNTAWAATRPPLWAQPQRRRDRSHDRGEASPGPRQPRESRGAVPPDRRIPEEVAAIHRPWGIRRCRCGILETWR